MASTLADDDARALLRALESSLLEAGYADAADQIRRVANEAINADERDDAHRQMVAIQVMRRLADPKLGQATGDTMLYDPSLAERLSAAVKIVDLMVIEPLRIEQRLPAIWRRAQLDVGEMSVGDGDAAVVLRPQLADSSEEALDAWMNILSDLRAILDDGQTDDR